ncbi:MAG TPA: antibiotic biosynthesis monooxygenase family protein [Stellaceae bacterium]|nr:antibiotic biosynthesis monooxygenase family protein [Stellaceae bacterium]
MVTMINLHIVNPAERERAIRLLKKNTELARKAKGFVSREIYFSAKDPLKGYSIATWETREDMEAFLKSPGRPALVTEGPEKRVYEKTPAGNILLFTSTDPDVFELVEVP